MNKLSRVNLKEQISLQRQYKQKINYCIFTEQAKLTMSEVSSPKTSIQSGHKSSKKSQPKQKSKNNELQQLIIQNQNFTQQYQGFYTIEQWRKLNHILFNPTQYQQKTTVTNCWRLMKLINFGDDIIPTGLIFDCVMTLMNVDQTVEQTELLLKAIFLKFIQLNGKHLTEKQRQELAFFKVVRLVVEGYRKIISEKLDAQISQDFNHQKPHDRNQQLYLLHGVMTYKKDLERLKKIQTEVKYCSFQPKINQLSAQIGQSRYRNPSSAKSIDSPTRQENECMVIDQEEEFDHNFKAKPLPTYPEYEPSRQYEKHIQRMQKSRDIKSINSLIRRSHTNSQVKEFSIQERDEIRKMNALENVRILFMIKVEVGKRVYRVKVRQNMGVSETVTAIERMVGFKSTEIIDVVKSYFLNWERREKAKKHQDQQHSVYQESAPY